MLARTQQAVIQRAAPRRGCDTCIYLYPTILFVIRRGQHYLPECEYAAALASVTATLGNRDICGPHHKSLSIAANGVADEGILRIVGTHVLHTSLINIQSQTHNLDDK